MQKTSEGQFLVLGRCVMKIDQFTGIMMAVRGQSILSVCGSSLASWKRTAVKSQRRQTYTQSGHDQLITKRSLSLQGE